MWGLQNHTPFATERTWVRDKRGAEIWLVAVKATYVIQPDGTTQIADEQVPITRVPAYSGEPGKSSLLYECDLVHTKPTTDVFLHGYAYAPNGKPATRVNVTLNAAGVSKTLTVTGDRTWIAGALMRRETATTPFQKMPIVYERAFGGTDAKTKKWEDRNPIGVGFAGPVEGQLLPNVEHASKGLGAFHGRQGPAGFGPIARDWSPRVKFAGTYDAKWEQDRLPLLPEDFDERFYQCAPEDQQTPAYLQGGEPVELHNLTPHGILGFNLPKETLGFQTFFTAGEVVHHRAHLHTVILEPEASRVVMVWHTMLPCHPKVYKLQWTRVVRKWRLGSVTRSRQAASI